jgi:hypothetical protein
MIAFFFACYGAGMPQLDDFAHRVLRQPVAVAGVDTLVPVGWQPAVRLV